MSPPVAAPAPAVFVARGVTKTYHMGEVDVRALAGVDLDLYEGERPMSRTTVELPSGLLFATI